MTGRRGKTGRKPLLDVIRGITLFSMIAYHGAWDLVNLAGVSWPWYQSRGAFVWQQSICWTFILLSGFCMTLSVHKWKRGATVFAAGLLVTGATLVFLPEDRVVFGVLTFLGSAMLLTALLERVLEKIPALLGILLFAFLFYAARWIGRGYLQLPEAGSFYLPATWYQGNLMTYLGFQDPAFFSTDYFPLLPWIFLYWCGFELGRLVRGSRIWRCSFWQIDIPFLSAAGRSSLLIYLLHQPVLYMLTVLATRYFPLTAFVIR